MKTCLNLVYGQTRTLSYCLPYLKAAFGLLPDINLKWHFVVKDYDNEINSKIDSSIYLSKTPNLPEGSTSFVVTQDVEQRLDYNHYKAYHYSKLISTLYNCLTKIIELEKTCKIDTVFLTRCDSLVGDSISSLLDTELDNIQETWRDPFCIYANYGVFRLHKEFENLGMGDFFYYGSSTSIKLLILSLLKVIERKKLDYFPYYNNIGPNVLLYRASVENNICIRPTAVDVAIVRKTSDLNLDVYTSFNQHQKHFIETHSGL